MITHPHRSLTTGAASVRGFTLIQLSILLTIASLTMVAVLPSFQSPLNTNALTASRMNTVLIALRAYQLANGVLPCPADASQPIGSTTYGVTAANPGTTNNCNNSSPAANFVDNTNHVAIGMVPVKTLNLSNDYALDGFGNTITYAVDTDATTSWVAPNFPGTISVKDNGLVNNAVLVLVSHGANGHGAWIPRPGSTGTAVQLNAGSTDTDELTNAHVDSNFNPITTLNNFVRKIPTSTFDDIVVYKNPAWSLNQLPSALVSAPLIANNFNPTYTMVTSYPSGIYSTGQTLSFTITFPAAVIITGTPQLALNIGLNTRYANYVSSTGATATFTYTLVSGDVAPAGISLLPYINLNGGTISVSGSTAAANYFTPPSLANVSVNGWSYYRTITISHTYVSNTTQTNFPILFSGTYSYLATVANGGNVTSSSGNDIVFTSDAGGANPLSFEQESYSPTTGQVNYWIKIPSLSPTTDTVIYMFYGNSNINTFQSTPSSTWDNYYMGVWHYPSSSALSTADSTISVNTGTNNNAVTATTGKQAGGTSFTGSSAMYINQGNALNLQLSNGTISAWVKTSSSSGDGTYSAIMDKSGAYNLLIHNNSTLMLYDYGSSTARDSGTAIVDGTWHYVTTSFQSGVASGTVLYVDGASKLTTTMTNSLQSNGLYLGWTGSSTQYFTGTMDEVRVSNMVRSSDWIKTEYNNQNSPSTFYTVGSAVTVAH